MKGICRIKAAGRGYFHHNEAGSRDKKTAACSWLKLVPIDCSVV